MILYLSRNESAGLLDGAARENALHVRKLPGNFSLSEFIVRDMRKFASCRYFCVERLAITETDDGFLEALQSFRMMYSARIIVIHENEGGLDALARELARIGVTDIVTAADGEEKRAQIAECLSDEGMRRYRPRPAGAGAYDDEPDGEYEEKETLAQSLFFKEMEDEHYRFDCLNVNIGVIGATRRVGTTTAALGLAGFIQNHGGTACYAALNTNRHLESIAAVCGFDAEEDYYTRDAIDYYEGMLPKHDYNFIVTDYGDIKRETVRKYKESDVRLLCGASGERFEIAELAEGLKAVRSVKPRILTYAPNPEHDEFFRSAVTKEPAILRPAGNMLDFKTNAAVFKEIIAGYIVETSKRL
jgi:hypothetical protein